jgi:hypothetical protein
MYNVEVKICGNDIWLRLKLYLMLWLMFSFMINV